MIPTGARTRPTDEIPSSSMADIAFLLLIFFLVTTIFPKDRGLALVLPPDETTQEVAPENLLRFQVDAAGSVRVRPGTSLRWEPIPVERIDERWRREHAANDRLVAVVESDAAAPYGAMVDVLDALQGAGADRISLRVGDGA